MSDETLVQTLMEECRFAKSIATAYVRAGGRCEYCGRDLLRDRQGYASGALDHLLPKSTPDINPDQPQNWVLSCSLCNSVKRDHNVLPEARLLLEAEGLPDAERLPDAELARRMLSTRREKLIDLARQYIQGRMKEYDDTWRLAIDVLADKWWSRAGR